MTTHYMDQNAAAVKGHGHKGRHGHQKRHNRGQFKDYFTMKDFTRSQTASRLGIENVPPKETHIAIRHLVNEILIPVIEEFGECFIVTSGYRCKELNDAIGGSKTSAHMWKPESAAVDIDCTDKSGIDNLTLAHWIEENIEFDQLISECYDPKVGPTSGWNHVAIKTDGSNRNESLTYQKGKGYSQGLPSL